VRILRGAELLEGGDRRAALAVGGERLIHGSRRLPARLLRALDQLGILTEDGGIDHPSSLVSGMWQEPGSGWFAARTIV
jgi:hypothetical protein